MPDTDHVSQPGLLYNEIIPAFSLPGSDGASHSPWDYKQRENLILLFTSSTTSAGHALLRAFAEQYSDFREEICSILAITAETERDNLQVVETLHLPFPLLADPQGKIIARYTYWESSSKSFSPGIVLANRYNALYKQWTATSEEELPPITELLESLQYLNLLCTP